jgi:phage shock protein A
MDEAENLRRQAKRALRLAEAILDQQTIQALTAHAATLLERAQSLEQTPPVLSDQQPQQQQQVTTIGPLLRPANQMISL